MEVYCSCGASGKCKTSGHAGAASSSSTTKHSSSYTTTTHELFVEGTPEKPIGSFDASNRQCKLDLRDPLNSWNRWAFDFNTFWSDYLDHFKKLKEASPDLAEWAKGQVDSNLTQVQSAVDQFRTAQKHIKEVAPGGENHPAVKQLELEIKKGIAKLRDARDEVDSYWNQHFFDQKVELHVKGAKAAIAEGNKPRDSATGQGYYIDDFKGDLYAYGLGHGMRVCDIFKVALGELEKAKAVLASDARGKGHRLTAEIEKLIKDAKEGQEKLCVKWGVYYATNETDMALDQAKIYRDALQQQLGNVPGVATIDKAIAAGTLKQAKADAEREERAKLASDKRKFEAEELRKTLIAKWKTPFTGGKVACDKEVWVYTAEGKVTSGGITLQWDGEYLTGNVQGHGDWAGRDFYWRCDNHDIYVYRLDNRDVYGIGEVPVNFQFDGQALIPAKDNWAMRAVRVTEGKVPFPVMLAIALRPYAEKRGDLVAGRNLCKSALFNEGSQGVICDDCSHSTNMHCAVCADKLSFARNPALVCKYCKRDYCMRCGKGSSLKPAVVCDGCRMKFSGQCTRNKGN